MGGKNVSKTCFVYSLVCSPQPCKNLGDRLQTVAGEMLLHKKRMPPTSSNVSSCFTKKLKNIFNPFTPPKKIRFIIFEI